MKKLYYITKTITQIFLYLIEVVGISIILAYFSTFLEAYTTLYNFIERCISFYTIYQILVVVILTNINDIQKDLTLSYMTNLKKHFYLLCTLLTQKCRFYAIFHSLRRGMIILYIIRNNISRCFLHK